MSNRALVVALSLVLAPLGAVLRAQDPGTLWLKVGAGLVDPKSGNGSLAGHTLDVDLGSSARPTVALEAFVARHLGVELLAAWPFRHEVRLDGVRAATVDQLPPTLSLQYHFTDFTDGGVVAPYVGLGVTWVQFFSEKTTGPLAGHDLALGSSLGVAAHGGVDWQLSDRVALGADVRWMEIDSAAEVDGVDVGKVEVDPLVYGVYLAFDLNPR